MKQINSPHEFEAMLQAERVVLFISLPWSRRSELSRAIVAEWKRKTSPNYPVFELEPDGNAFAWQWLDSIFGDASEQERAGGAVLWLRKGSVAAILPDAGVAGAKALTRMTHDCFTLGKNLTHDSIAALLSEPAAFDAELLKILCCPETHQALALAEAAILDKLNQRLASGRLQNRSGQPIREKIEDGLVRTDGRYLYPLRRNIPILLVEEAIPLGG